MARSAIRNPKSQIRHSTSAIRDPRSEMATHQILIVSDATGRTAEMVVRAALVQFQGAEGHLSIRPHVRTVEAVRAAVRAAGKVRGLIVHTLVSPELRNVMLTEGRAGGGPTIDVLG